MAALFRYRALDPSGGEVSGDLQGSNRLGAMEALVRRGLTPIEVTPSRSAVVQPGAAPVGRRSSLFRLRFNGHGPVLKLQRWLSLVQSLAALLRAGLPVDRALQIAGPLAQGEAARRAVALLLEAVRQGATLSDALRRHGQGLPPYYVSMIDAGEASGALPQAVSQLSTLMARQVAVRERLRSALIYPALLASMVLVTLFVLLVFVLPRFEVLFAEATSVLPWSTRVVLAFGRLVADFWWLGLGLIALVTAWAAAGLRSTAGRERFDRWVLQSRLTLGLPSAVDGARLFRTLGSLCAGGQPLAAALRIALGTVANRAMRSGLEQVMREVQAGGTLSQSLARARVFPVVAVQMARVGEETGCLEQMLQAAADVLEDDSQRRLERLVTIAIPGMTVLMGLVVAILIGSVLIGLLSINDLAF